MIRNYLSSDKLQVLELLQLNTPEFFATSEQKELEQYLENEVEDYFVVEENNKIIGAGGINYVPKKKIATISWDIIAPDSQGKGIGRKLVQHRLDRLKGNQNINSIVVRTSQLTYIFYEKMGFKLEKVETDFWAKNYHLYQMELKNK